MNQGMTKAPERRSLLDRPQKLGFLPTVWFWNDWEAQRLLLPLICIITPGLVLLNLVQLWLRLGAWIPIAANVVIPFLTMGLVERYVRARLLAAGKTSELPRPATHDARRGRDIMLSMGLFSGVLTALVLLDVSAVVLGAVVLLGGFIIAIVLRRTRRDGRDSGLVSLRQPSVSDGSEGGRSIGDGAASERLAATGAAPGGPRG